MPFALLARRRVRASLSLALALASVLAVAADAPVFGQPKLTKSVGGPFAVFVDLNGDGVRDALGLSNTWGAASFLAVADGTLSLHDAISPGFTTATMAVGDLDGDGDLDAAMSGNVASPQLAVAFNDGGGGFGSAVSIALTAVPSGLRTADVDGDGDLDVLALYASSIGVHLNDGSGALAAAVVTTAASGTSRSAFADLTGDGRADFAQGIDGDLVVRPGQADGSFGTGTTIDTTLDSIFSVAIGDMDQDGELDVVLGGATVGGAPQAYVAVLLRPDGVYDAPALLPIPGPAPSHLALVDAAPGMRRSIASDCTQDSVIRLCFLVGTDSGWNASYTLPIPAYFYTFASVPADALADPRVVALAIFDTTEYWPDGAGGLRNDHLVLRDPFGGAPGGPPLTGDHGGDGDEDLLIPGSSILRIWANDGVGNLGADAFLPEYENGVAITSNSLAVGDFDADGTDDIYLGTNGTPGFVFSGGPGDAQWTVRRQFAYTSTGRAGVFVDLDLDGADELVGLSRSNATDAELRVVRPVGSTAVAIPDGLASTLVAGDFDEDGDPDLAVGYTVPARVEVLLNGGDGSAFTASTVTLPAAISAQDPVHLLAGDVDGDGDADLVFVTGGRVGVVLSNGDGTFDEGPFTIFDFTPVKSPQLFDFDGDGDLDLAVLQTSNAAVQLYLNHGDGTMVPEKAYLVLGNPGWLGHGDLDGNRRRDLLVVTGSRAEVLLGDPQRPAYRRAPSAAALVASLDVGLEDDLEVALYGRDPDHDPITYILQSVTAGTVSEFDAEAGTLTYTPPAGFDGTATVFYRVSDGTDQSELGRVDILVFSSNQAPVANGANLTLDTSQAVSRNITFVASDPDGDAITLASLTNNLGTITNRDDGSLSLTFTPPAAFNGTGVLTYTVTDGDLESNAAVVSIAVTSPNTDIKLTATTADKKRRVNGNVPFNFTIANLTKARTTAQVVLRVPVPANGQFVSGTIAGGACVLDTGVVICTRSTPLRNGTPAKGTITFKAIATGQMRFTGTVSIRNTDPAPANNTDIVNKKIYPAG